MNKLLGVLISLLLLITIMANCSMESLSPEDDEIQDRDVRDEDLLWEEAADFELTELEDETGLKEKGINKRSASSKKDSPEEKDYRNTLKANTRAKRRYATRLKGGDDPYSQRITYKRGIPVYTNPGGSIFESDSGLIYNGDLGPCGNVDDLIIGTMSEETFYGGKGFNWINGKGGIDKVYFDNPREEYIIRNWGRKHLTITHKRGAYEPEVTRLKNIEKLIFEDGYELFVRYYIPAGKQNWRWSDSDAFGDTLDDKKLNYIMIADRKRGEKKTDFLIWDGKNSFFGAHGQDIIRGSKGQDNIYANGGDDIIFTGKGKNAFIHGGSGMDTVLFHHPLEHYKFSVEFENGIPLLKFLRKGNKLITLMSCERFIFNSNGPERKKEVFELSDKGDDLTLTPAKPTPGEGDGNTGGTIIQRF